MASVSFLGRAVSRNPGFFCWGGFANPSPQKLGPSKYHATIAILD